MLRGHAANAYGLTSNLFLVSGEWDGPGQKAVSLLLHCALRQPRESVVSVPRVHGLREALNHHNCELKGTQMDQIAFWPTSTFSFPWREPIEPDHVPFYHPGHIGFADAAIHVTRKILIDVERNPTCRQQMIRELRQFMRMWAGRSPVLN